MLAIGKKLDSPLGLFHLGSCSFSLNYHKTSLVKFNLHLNGQILITELQGKIFTEILGTIFSNRLYWYHQQGNLILLLTKITPPEGSIRTWDELWFSFRVLYWYSQDCLLMLRLRTNICSCGKILHTLPLWPLYYYHVKSNGWYSMDDKTQSNRVIDFLKNGFQGLF